MLPTWLQLGEDLDGEAAGDGSGFSVALSSDGKTVAIGAWGNNDNGVDAGHVRIFRETLAEEKPDTLVDEKEVEKVQGNTINVKLSLKVSVHTG